MSDNNDYEQFMNMWKKFKQNKQNQKRNHRNKEQEKPKPKHITAEINDRLDIILNVRSEINRMRAELKSDSVLYNKNTGEEISRDDIINGAENNLNKIKQELNEITNDGKNIKEIFTNKFYINDLSQDKKCKLDVDTTTNNS